MVDENITLIHSDNYCVIMQSNDPREMYLADPVQLMERVWCNKPTDYNEYRTNLRSEHYGKRVFYIYNMCDQIVEFKVVDLAAEDKSDRGLHPLLVDGGIVMTPLKNKHEILEYVLFDELVGKRDEE